MNPVDLEKTALLLEYPTPVHIRNALLDKKINRRSKFRKQAIEEILASDPNTAYWYASYVIKGPFPLGEEAIAQSLECSFAYSLIIGRFEMGEEAIAKKQNYHICYCIIHELSIISDK